MAIAQETHRLGHRSINRYAQRRLPPGPAAPRAVQTLHYGLRPYDFLTLAQRRYGDAFTLRVLSETWVVLTHPDAVGDVFSLGHDAADAGVANMPLRPILGTRNVLLLDGDEHLTRKRLVLPAFHGETLRSARELIRQIAHSELGNLPTGHAVSLFPHFQRLIFEVTLSTVFGSVAAEWRALLDERLRRLVAWTTDKRRVFIYALLGPERLGHVPTYARQLKALDDAVLEGIRRRRDDEGSAGGCDALALLLAARDENGAPLSDRDVRDELVTLVIAGYETTTALLSWAQHDLARAPAYQVRLAAGEEGLADAVVKEALRLHPPAPLVAFRRLRRPAVLGGHRLGAGTTIALCPVLTHRRPEIYPEPEAFRPERFLGARPLPRAWLPFGGGVRRCLGAPFAELEARTVIDELARGFELRPDRARTERVDRRGSILIPARGCRVVATAR
jgi:cytochrome P450 family 135